MMKKFLFVFVALTLVFVSGVSVSAASTVISEDRAKEIVINDAGVSADDVVFTKFKLDKKAYTYEIKFTCDRDKYEYEVSAKNGTILKREWDIKETAAITEEQAKELAVNDAGVNIDEVVFTKVKLDEKTSVYEIKFTCNKDKYEYEISIKDGSILSKEWDIKESTSQPTRPDESAKPDYSAVLAQAEEVALSTAGIDRAVTTYVNSYLNYEKGVPCNITVEFGVYVRGDGTQKYHYVVDFEGNIL